MEIKTIAVIGAGTMGNGIAHTFAQNQFWVHLIDTNDASLNQGQAAIVKNLDRMVQKNILTQTEKEQITQRIKPYTQLQQGIQGVDLVVEAATENQSIKQIIFKELDQHCAPHCILASNTSSISITKIAAATQRQDRVIGMHFMNPVPLMKLVEVINGYNTSQETYNIIHQLCIQLGKTPVTAADYPGFVANRILMPMINEAIETLYHRVAGVAEIDAVMKLGMAHPMGPLQLADFIGLDVCLSILEVMYSGFKNPKYAPCPLLVNMVMAGKLGIKTGEGFYNYTQSQKAEIVATAFQK